MDAFPRVWEFRATDPQEIRQSAFERMQDRDFKLDLAEPVKSHDVFGGLKAHDISSLRRLEGFEYFSCSPRLGKMIQFDEYIFQMG